jgi:hypothetical protein
MAITIPNIFVPNTLVQSTPVNSNFSTIETYINTTLETASAHNADIALLPKGKMGYAQITANQTGITSVVDITSLTLTFTALASRYYRVSGFGLIQSTVADDMFAVTVTDSGGTGLQQASIQLRVANVSQLWTISYVVQPGAGSKTYKLRAQRASGTGSGTITASATFPNYILIEDIGL